MAASQSDLLWLDQADLIAAIEDHPEIRPCLETIAEKNKNVRGLFCTMATNVQHCCRGLRNALTMLFTRRSSFLESQVPFPVWRRNVDDQCN